MTGRATIASGMFDPQPSLDPSAAATAVRLRVVRSDSLDPYVNLALEQQLFDDLSPDEVVLYLWQNRSSVVIGRHQNPWIECDLDAMRLENVQLVRRVSGGGAVYHDPGNGNFTFLAPASAYSERRQFSLVIAALRKLGIEAVLSERNDILIGNRKVSGNAFRYRKDKSYHHGTLLVATDLDRLTRFLNPTAGGVLESKGIASVRSRVVNLSELHRGLTWDDVCEALIAAADSEYGSASAHLRSSPSVGERPLATPDALSERQRELAGWEWIFGHTPDFRRVHAVAAGSTGPAVRIELAVHRGRITEALPDDGTTGLTEALHGVRYRPEDLQQRSRELQSERRPGSEICLELARQLAATAGLPLAGAKQETVPREEQS